VREVLALGAHCDDLEIGCGGAILRLVAANADLRVRWIVWSSNAEREAEGRASAGRFLEGLADRVVEFHSFRDGYFPSERAAIKDRFELLKTQVSPDLILTHAGNDAHQDHRVIHELTWNTFRDHLILEYEIPKYDPDVGNPNSFVALDEPSAQRKVRILMDTFASQRDKRWFTEETFYGWMRMRAVHAACPSRYAEAFYARKIVLGV
jgi:LmbE family N-acetylglucosaminyl deacetylase